MALTPEAIAGGQAESARAFLYQRSLDRRNCGLTGAIRFRDKDATRPFPTIIVANLLLPNEEEKSWKRLTKSADGADFADFYTLSSSSHGGVLRA